MRAGQVTCTDYPSTQAGFCVKATDPSSNELFGRFLIVFVVSLLFVKLKHLIKWTTHDVLLKTKPTIFRKHCPRCVMIIDGFEIFIDHLTDLLAGPRHTHNINIITRSNISLVLHSKAQLVPSQMDGVAGQVINISQNVVLSSATLFLVTQYLQTEDLTSMTQLVITAQLSKLMRSQWITVSYRRTTSLCIRRSSHSILL